MYIARWICGILIVGAVGFVLFYSPHSTRISNTASPNTASSTSAAIPGDNLTLGEGTDPHVGSYLVGYNGMTLYTNTKDSVGVSNCAGDCATTWPPYIVTSTANLVGEYPIAGVIGTLARADGSVQVMYNGHLLYFYSGDSINGDIKGQSKGGVWALVSP